MKVNTQIVRDTLKKLPVGYYIGKEVKVIPEDNIETSYYDMLSDVIHISTNSIVDTVSRLTDKATIEDIEKDVRCMLYHELSHAMLTPRNLKPTFQVNVVEDIRIESRLKDYYLNTDFDEFNKRYISATPDDCPQNGFIRFCKLDEGGNDELRDQLSEILRKFGRMDSRTDSWSARSFSYEVNDLYDNYYEWWKKNHYTQDAQDQGNADEQMNDNGEGQGSGSGQSESSEVAPNEVPTSSDDQGDEETAEDYTPGHEQSRGQEIAGLMKSITNEYYNQELITEFDRILRNFKKVTSARSSAINAYSGVFNPRSAGREDYRYFLQHNANGNNKGFSKIHLNLFLDESGSFSSSEHTAKELIYTLGWMEKQIPNFDFTLIRCGEGETIADKNDLRYSAHTGTEISTKIFDTFKKVQRRDAENYNILLYDGRAFSHWASEGTDGWKGNFAAYNTSNTLIITDPENGDAVNEYCPAARKVISKNYTEELKKNLIKMTEILLK